MTLKGLITVALAATALIAAGCGGDDKKSSDTSSTSSRGYSAPTAPRGYSTSGAQLSVADYKAKVKASKAKSDFAGGTADARASKKGWEVYTASLRTLAKKTAALNPPTQFQAANAQLAEAYGDAADAGEEILAAAKAGDTGKIKVVQKHLDAATARIFAAYKMVFPGG
jgi:hypothetical protein